MDMVLQVAAVCVVASVLSLVLQKSCPEIGLVLTLSTVVLVGLFLLDSIGQLLEILHTLTSSSGMREPLMVPIYKILGIGAVVRIGESLCRDAGDSALAAVVETAGAVCAFLAAIPLLDTVLDMLMELMQ